MDATCTIQDSIHVFNLVHKYVSRILGTYQILDYHLGYFSKFEKYPKPACYIHTFIGEKKSNKKNFPNTHSLHHTQIHEIRHIT